VQVLVFNKKGEMWVQWRSRNRAIHPRQFGASAAGGVNVGESYEQAAHRELKEELGIAKAKLKHIGKLSMGGKTPYFSSVFVCVSDIKNLTGWETEADALDLLSGEEIVFLLKRFPYLFTNGLTAALQQLDDMEG
jgi:8-oxo-dGTP pyrophosphatase MutT (NUDIX family)